MATNIQIRNVPEKVHRTLKARAAQAGKSLSELLLDEITQLAALATPEGMRKRRRSHNPVMLAESAALAVRKERGS
ncbi:MAG: hypothetical protein WAT39_21785 [Planctomycetota bacterium]